MHTVARRYSRLYAKITFHMFSFFMLGKFRFIVVHFLAEFALVYYMTSIDMFSYFRHVREYFIAVLTWKS